jgi:hypothetical protein
MDFEFPDNINFAELLLNEKLPDLQNHNTVDFSELITMALFLANDFWSSKLESEAYDEYLENSHPQENKVTKRNSVLIINKGDIPTHIVIKITKQDGEMLCEVKYDLISITNIFAQKALIIANNLLESGTIIPNEDLRTLIIKFTGEMLEQFLDKVEKRTEISVSSFINEIALKSLDSWFYEFAFRYSLEGFKIKDKSFSKDRDSLLKTYQKRICLLWTDNRTDALKMRKMILAYHHKIILEHLEEVERIQRRLGGEIWRRYIRAGDMSDIADDLIQEFEATNDFSDLAIQHAARRAKIYNIYNVKDNKLKKRANKIKDSGYSRSRLFKFKDEGDKLLEELGIDTRSPGWKIIASLQWIKEGGLESSI